MRRPLRRAGSWLLQPLAEIHGVSNKLLSMALADLFLGGDPDRERWVVTGASMIAIDTLVHNFLHRQGFWTDARPSMHTVSNVMGSGLRRAAPTSLRRSRDSWMR